MLDPRFMVRIARKRCIRANSPSCQVRRKRSPDREPAGVCRCRLVEIVDLEIIGGIAEAGEVLLNAGSHRSGRTGDRGRRSGSGTSGYGTSRNGRRDCGRVVIGIGTVNGERSLRRGCGGLLHHGLGLDMRGVAAMLAGSGAPAAFRGLLADFGKLASGVGDEVIEQVAIILARLLAIILELVNGIDDLLAIVLGLVEDTVGLVLSILDRGGSIGLGVGQDLVGGALGDDERLGDGVAVGLLGLELLLELGDAGIALGDGGILLGQDGRVDGVCGLVVLLGGMLGLGLVEHLVVEGGRAVEAGERVLADLALQRGDLLIQAVDLIGDVLEEDIDLVDVAALAIDGSFGYGFQQR